jgi:hypothetical protein
VPGEKLPHPEGDFLDYLAQLCGDHNKLGFEALGKAYVDAPSLPINILDLNL